MMELSPLQFFGSLGGIGAVFGFLMWILLDRLIKQIRQDRMFMEDRLTGIIGRYNEKCDRDADNMKEFTKTLYELHTWLKTKNGNH